MTDAGRDNQDTPVAQRRNGRILSVTAALLLIGGGVAVATGLLDQTPPPPAPPAAAAGSVSGNGTAPAPSSPADSSGSSSADPSDSSSAADASSRPTRIRIPAIGVTSDLTVVGLKKDGTLQVPKPGPDYDKAAWFKGSPVPGAVGPSVIEGHVDGKANGPSVFYRLGNLRPGNKVMVTRKDGTKVTFVVNAVRLYPKDEFPTLKVYGNTRGPELRLITCGGPFDSNRAESGYTDNVVVFASQA